MIGNRAIDYVEMRRESGMREDRRKGEGRSKKGQDAMCICANSPQ